MLHSLTHRNTYISAHVCFFMATEKDDLTLVRLEKKRLDNLKRVQAYLVLQIGHDVPQQEALAYLIEEFLAGKNKDFGSHGEAQ